MILSDVKVAMAQRQALHYIPIIVDTCAGIGGQGNFLAWDERPVMSETDAPPGAATPGGVDTDGYGRSALLLVESLIHGLIDRKVISCHDAVEITSSAHEVLRAINDDMPAEFSSQCCPEQPLLSILASLEIDAPA